MNKGKGWNWRDILLEWVIIFFAIVAIFLLISIAFHGKAASHSFYDIECCSNKDCAPVTLMQKHPDGDVMTTMHGTVLVKPTDRFSRKVSPDGEFHVCMRRAYPTQLNKSGSYDMQVICIYYPQQY